MHFRYINLFSFKITADPCIFCWHYIIIVILKSIILSSIIIIIMPCSLHLSVLCLYCGILDALSSLIVIPCNFAGCKIRSCYAAPQGDGKVSSKAKLKDTGRKGHDWALRDGN